MSARHCIQAKIRAGKIRAAEGQRYLAELDQLEAAAGKKLGIHGAASQAAGDLAMLLKRQIALEKKRARLSLEAQARFTRLARQHPKGHAGAMRKLLVGDSFGIEGNLNVALQTEVIRAQLQGGFAAGLKKLRPRWLGQVQDTLSEEKLVRALFGETVDDPDIAAIAKEWGAVTEGARQRANRAGADIGYLEDWRLANKHDALKVYEAGRDEWVKIADQTFDIKDAAGKPLADGSFEKREALRAAWETLSSGGLNKVTPGAGGGRGMLAARRDNHRILHPKSGQAWLDYDAKFGEGNIFRQMMGHLDGMANDIALLEVLGPNPQHLLRWMGDETRLAAQAAGGPKAAGVATRAVADAEGLFRHLTGAADVAENPALAHWFREFRAYLVSSKLGSAIIPSLFGDTAAQAITRRFNGLPVMSVASGIIRQLGADREAAARLGVVAETWCRVAAHGGRATGEVLGTGIMSRMADATMRASGLSAFTDASKAAFELEFRGTLAGQAGRSLKDLPYALQTSLRRGGIDDQAWDLLRRHPATQMGGADFMDPVAMAASPDAALRRAAETLHRHIIRERRHAVMEPDAEVRWLKEKYGLGGQAGTIGGELRRTAGMLKTMPMLIYTTHVRRMLDQTSLTDRLSYGAVLFLTMTVTGYLTVQSRAIVQGREPMPLTEDNALPLLGMSILSGGALGIFGDFLFSETNRFGGGIETTMMGPGAAAVGDILSLTIGNLVEAGQGEKTNAGHELRRFIGQYTPGSSLWYARLGFERAVLDTLSRWIDPDFERRVARMTRKQIKETGQDYWWAPGESLPEFAQ